MRNLFLITISILSPLFLKSQSYNIQWGPVIDKEGGLFAGFSLAGLTDSVYTVYSTPGKKNLLISYDWNHKEIANIDIEEKTGRKNISFRHLIKLKNKTIAYFFEDTKEDNQWRILAAPFEAGKLGTLKQVFNKTYKDDLTGIHIGRQLGIHYNGHENQISEHTLKEYAVSSDQSKIVIMNIQDGKAIGPSVKLCFVVFDPEMNVLWDKTVTLESPNNAHDIISLSMANDGTILCMYKVDRRDSKIKSKDRDPYTLSLLKVNQAEHKDLVLRMPSEYQVDEAQLFIPRGEKEEMVIAGFFTKNREEKDLEGIFVCKVPISITMLQPILHRFPDSLLHRILTRRELKKKDGIRSSFHLDHLLQLENGRFGFLTEERYSYTTITTSTTGTGGTRTRTYYVATDILVPIFDESGKLLAIPHIEKAYTTQEYGSESYAHAYHDGRLYVIYNDHKTGEERRDLKEEGKKGRIYSDMSVISSNGQLLSQSTLFTNKDHDLLFVPYISNQHGSHFLVGAMSINKFSFGFLELQ